MATSFAPIIAVSPSQPEDKVLQKAIDVFKKGGVVAFPTDTLYGIGCMFGENDAIKRIQTMRGFDIAQRPLTFLLPDLGEVPRYALVTDSSYNVLRKIFPGPYCAELLV
jgi:tRNA threonylcarbamoyl adenosine modification protein (Sua5/YciO/YrdC/YwlC family)